MFAHIVLSDKSWINVSEQLCLEDVVRICKQNKVGVVGIRIQPEPGDKEEPRAAAIRLYRAYLEGIDEDLLNSHLGAAKCGRRRTNPLRRLNW
jgi:hypothetical protein